MRLLAEVAVLRPDGRRGRLDERGGQVHVAWTLGSLVALMCRALPTTSSAVPSRIAQTGCKYTPVEGACSPPAAATRAAPAVPASPCETFSPASGSLVRPTREPAGHHRRLVHVQAAAVLRDRFHCSPPSEGERSATPAVRQKLPCVLPVSGCDKG